MAHLTDMEELLSTISSLNIREYMREAMNCYMAGAYRGTIVLSYIALFDDILLKLDGFRKVNTDANTIFKEANNKKDSQEVFENYLIENLKSKKLLPELDCEFLEVLQKLRNKAAHPSGHLPSAEEARFIFRETIFRFLSRPVLSTTYLIDEIIARLKNPNFFTSDDVNEIQAIVQKETKLLHEEGFAQLIYKLIAKIVDVDENSRKNAKLFITGLTAQKINDQLIQRELLNNKSDDEKYAETILLAMVANGNLICLTDEITKSRINQILLKKLNDYTGLYYSATQALISICDSLPEDQLLISFKTAIKEVFHKSLLSDIAITIATKDSLITELYFPILLEHLSSSSFHIANKTVNSIAIFDAKLASALTDYLSFEIMTGILKSASSGAFESIEMRDSNFTTIPLIKEKSISYIKNNLANVEECWLKELSSKSSKEFINNFLTQYKI